MQPKIKEIFGSLLFLLGLLVLVILASVVLRPKDNTKAAGMEDVTANGILAEPEQTIDVLFLSDSVGYCSIIPMQIWRDHGITSYVCGTPAQPLYYSQEFLNKTFEKQSPKVVMLETMPIFKSFEEKEAVKNVAERVLPVFRYHDRWKMPEGLLAQSAHIDVDYTYRDVSKGYRHSMAIDPAQNVIEHKMIEAVAYLPEECKEAVKEINKTCEKHGAKLVLFGAPNMYTWSADRYNAVAYLAMELEIPYYELNLMQDVVQIDWTTDCYDAGEHLNYQGAQKVTTYIGQYLNSLGIFEDKRQNEEYKTWNEAQQIFYAEVAE